MADIQKCKPPGGPEAETGVTDADEFQKLSKDDDRVVSAEIEQR